MNDIGGMYGDDSVNREDIFEVCERQFRVRVSNDTRGVMTVEMRGKSGHHRDCTEWREIHGWLRTQVLGYWQEYTFQRLPHLSSRAQRRQMKTLTLTLIVIAFVALLGNSLLFRLGSSLLFQARQ
jgi:hypothetical protein